MSAPSVQGALVESARLIARGLIALGVMPGDRVSILGSTRAEWTLCDLGAVCAAAVVAPIYDTNSPAERAHVLRHSQARLVFCQDAAQVAKIAVIRDSCPDLEHVVVMDDGDVPGTIALSELIRNAESMPATEVDDRMGAVAAKDLATIVYTSGTTGPAKGCMLIRAEVQTDVDAVNTRFARIEQIKRFAILDRDLTEDGGELTPTLKVKRNVVYRKYARFFADIYAGV